MRDLSSCPKTCSEWVQRNGRFFVLSESCGGLFVQGDIQQLGKTGDAGMTRLIIMSWASGWDPAHSITIWGMNKQRVSISFSNRINSAFSCMRVGVATEEPGWASALSLVPQPLMPSPRPVPAACLHDTWRTCPLGQLGITSCRVSDLVLVADLDEVCPGTICQFPLCSQSVGKLTLP